MGNPPLRELLAPCHPLAEKLVEQQFGYLFDPADLELWLPYDQFVAQLPDPQTSGSLEHVDSLYCQEGFTQQERIWLNEWYQMAPDLKKMVAGEHKFEGDLAHYYPFEQRLEAIRAMLALFLQEKMIRLHDVDWLCLPEMARENVIVLPLAEKLLLNCALQAETGEKAAFPLSPHEEALLEFMHAQHDRLGQQSLLPPDPRHPSTERHEPWLYVVVSAWCQAGLRFSGQEKLPPAGKWVLNVPRQEIDEIWQKIVQATREGHLGRKARVSTLHQPKNQETSRPDHRIEVYTFDGRNKVAEQQVKKSLLELDISQPLSYYTN
jgi:hypothetical protein